MKITISIDDIQIHDHRLLHGHSRDKTDDNVTHCYTDVNEEVSFKVKFQSIGWKMELKKMLKEPVLQDDGHGKKFYAIGLFSAIEEEKGCHEICEYEFSYNRNPKIKDVYIIIDYGQMLINDDTLEIADHIPKHKVQDPR